MYIKKILLFFKSATRRLFQQIFKRRGLFVN